MIEVKNLTKRYGKKEIFNQLNTTFEERAVTILLGENGAGKSTLLRMIAKLETQDTGEIIYFGKDLSHKTLKNHLGYIPQDIALFEHLSVHDNIKFFKGLYTSSIDDNLLNIYKDALNLREDKAKVQSLSGGTKRKVNMLIGLLGNPDIIILDEPTVGIDLKSRYDIHRLINQLKQSKLIILTTHHLDEVEAIGDHIKLIGKDPFYKQVLTDKGWTFEDMLQ
ncbi:ATP-binding cassette domain-containing protein [Macrococcoides bohemicum]|uniref:ATP-binding cassette domain-containing protein n=1 Tax=Macrococcoides bohemicum TaxID=1903056 RepID=A0A4R5Y237_9STAP|nr:ATP-binding cassette domain-containing protein [Macrococcus bohemicus]MBC9874067.1 ATP-binding cassette domain-containing protein [Macrococcus bohemicus]QRN48801.1 ATP-binding cassette domain-containing protein [Macrococcus bohemicus]QYA42555.1 ATP-binding cassette domain-containing protein [Macrococcus bohemicus]QYA44937.1 ATP-binding cassette domain-containing protein [Macrococcus bohemicus]TDL38414.1 ABC transporter ATP-binding protein [Macrococcus bohemicus]